MHFIKQYLLLNFVMQYIEHYLQLVIFTVNMFDIIEDRHYWPREQVQ